jgi:hypothetical protein
MKPKEEMESTSNRSVYKKTYKKVVTNKNKDCSICPWHESENADGQKRLSKPKEKDFSRTSIKDFSND